MKFYKIIALLGLMGIARSASAQMFLNPNVGVGYNSVQNTYYHIGLDAGYDFDQNWAAGVGAYFAAGSHPSDDREIGGGPFVAYAYPLFEFLSVQLREDVDYVDQLNPFLASINPDVYSHTHLFGVESATYAGIHLSFTRNFGISAGYKLVVGLTDSALATGRSGVAFGVTLGF